jgi:hypothetical protein
MTWPLLLTVLAACSAWDLRTRTIPWWLLLLLGAATAAVTMPGWVAWSWMGTLVGVGATWAADLPGGDRWALALAGGLVGPWVIGTALGLAYLGLVIALRTVGRRRSLVGHPFFPYVAALTVIGFLLRPWIIP